MRYEFKSRVRYSELDENGKLSIHALINYFQDTSVFQSEMLGDGYKRLQGKGLAWILSSWQIVIHELPGFGEHVTAATWPYDFKYSTGLRNFVLTDGADRLYACANSCWVLFDVEKQKPTTVDEELIHVYGKDEPLEMDYAPRKIRVLGEGEARESFVVTRENLDTNHHVNNGEYIRMALAFLPAELSIRQLRVEYKQQAHLGDRIHPVVVRQEGIWQVLLNTDEGYPYAVVEITE
ncbi:MAG: thioesterase [Lachnospiraceae bacterium]|nr:thioesterase [Lachnospiraceae bacterium]